VRRLGAAIRLKTRRHALPHSAIQDALALPGSDVRAVQRFGRHQDLRTLLIYDDRRTDLAGDVARQVTAVA
jgi:integrase/recombinase XerC